MRLKVWWRVMADGKRKGTAVLLFRFLLAPLALFYGLAIRGRALLYRCQLLKTNRLPCPVISIGNITVGGTGKTPAVITVASELQMRGRRVVVLCRGYGGTLEGQIALVSEGGRLLLSPEQAGDEPCLLAKRLPGVAVLIGADRYQAGLTALERLNPDVILLDDGFQHIRLHRDLNILLLDSVRPFGNGWTIPSGLLREPRAAVKRADMILFTRCMSGQKVIETGIPGCCSTHCLTGFFCLADGNEIPLELLKQSRVAAFAGIAEPSSFFDSLRQQGLSLLTCQALPDHEPYHAKVLDMLTPMVEQVGADWLITTEKDGVKLVESDFKWSNRVLVARLDLKIDDNGKMLKSFLDRLPLRGSMP